MRPAPRSAAAALALTAALLTSCSTADSAGGDDAGTVGGGSAADEQADATRTVATDHGDVEVPVAPERVVVLNYALAGYLYNLDVPVTAVTPEDADQDEGAFSEFWAEDAEAAGTEFLPWTVDGFDLESVLEADPDLIVAGGLGFPLVQAEQVYDELTGIAPTVLVGGGLETWQEQFSFLAVDVFGQEDTYRELLAAHEQRVEEVREAITPPPAPAAYVTFTADQSPYVLIEDRGLPAELAAVGIEPAPVFADNDVEPYTSGGDMFTLSTEEVGATLDQPTLFVTGFNGDTTDVATLAGNPVYASLPSFGSGDAHDLPYWVVRADYDESLALLDIIEELFS